MPDSFDAFPDELRAELRINQNSVRYKVLDLLKQAERPMDLNSILIGLFKLDGSICKRPRIAVLMHRLVIKGRVKKHGYLNTKTPAWSINAEQEGGL